MNTYQNISNELKAYFSAHPIFKILLPLSTTIVYVSIAILILGHFIRFGVISTLAYYVFLFGLILLIANFDHKAMYISLFGFAGENVLSFFQNLFKYHYIEFGNLIPILIFGYLGYIVFKYVNTQKI